MAASRYTAEVDLENVNNSQTLAVLQVSPGSLVLDIGAADGSVARRLVERGCRVVGVEVDPRAASAAEQFCERVLVVDVETIDLGDALDGLEFDAVLLLDVLEHLRDPLRTLTGAAARLKQGGHVIMSVPNVTHAALRLQLLGGRFQYTDTGLLDKTHMHLYDRPALERLVAQAELTVIERMRTTAGLTETEIPIDPDVLPTETLELALSGEDADTYQFVYVAVPGLPSPPRPGSLSLGEALQRRAIAAERLRAEAEGYVKTLQARLGELERERDSAIQTEAAGRERTAGLERELCERMTELEGTHDDLRHAMMDIAVKDAQLAQLAVKDAELAQQLQTELAELRARLDCSEDVLGYARHKIVDRMSARAKRVPVVHRRLKWIAERLADRR